MFGRTKETKDVSPLTLFRQELAKILAAAKSRHIGLSVLASELQEHADALRIQAAVTYAPTIVHSGNI